MAMPPDGSSTWAHTSDSYVLLDPDGHTWGMLTVPLARDALTILLARVDDAWSYDPVLDLEVRGGRVTWRIHHPLLASPRERAWTREAAPDDLVPHPTLRRRGRLGDVVPDAPVVATVHVAVGADGPEARVVDADGVCRVLLALGRAVGGAGAPGEHGALLDGGALAVGYFLPASGARRVTVHATSMP